MAEYELKTEITEYCVKAYTSFKGQVHSPSSVFYPCCATDVSPSEVFGNVTYLDKREDFIKAVQEAGLTALCMDIRDYKPAEEHDLLILLNPAISSKLATPHLVKGGYILANNYHGNARELHNMQDEFDLFGVIEFDDKDSRNKNRKAHISRDLSLLFEAAKTEEDLKKYCPVCHEMLKKIFANPGMLAPGLDNDGTFDEVYERYREITHQGYYHKRSPEMYVFAKK